MTIFDKWDVVLVPLPFTDLSQTKKRPAVVLSSREYNHRGDEIAAFFNRRQGGTIENDKRSDPPPPGAQ
jgi:mRNA-degrading endonuclease toxin of MazEF toxin-antitoxin module